MINISKIFAINEKHNIKVNDIIVDNNGIKYKVLGICCQTNDLLVKPLSKIENLEKIKSIK